MNKTEALKHLPPQIHPPLISVDTKRGLQKGLLVLSVATSILSVIPPLRLAGALATRSVAFLATALDCTAKDFRTHRLVSIAKVAIVTLGLVGLATASPVLIITSLASDIGLQAIEMAKAIRDGESKRALAHGTLIVIDSLALGAILAGSWQLMVTAASVHAFAMFGFAIASLPPSINSWTDMIEPLCCFSFGVLGVASACISAKFTSRIKTNSKFSVENSSEETVSLYDKKGHLIIKINPGESASFEVPYKDTLQRQSYTVVPIGQNGGYSVVPILVGSYVKGITIHPNGDMITTRFDALSIDSKIIVTKQPLAVEHFPTLPIGDNAVTLTF